MKKFNEWLSVREGLDNRNTEQMFRDAIAKDGGQIGQNANQFIKTITQYSPEELPTIKAVVSSIQPGKVAAATTPGAAPVGGVPLAQGNVDQAKIQAQASGVNQIRAKGPNASRAPKIQF